MILLLIIQDLITKDLAKRLYREFDIFKLRTENVSQFIAYYALLLSTACQFELISQIEAEEISKEILSGYSWKYKLSELEILEYVKTRTEYEKETPLF